jgi:D-alanyl-D-alanine carboxypeptidase (penicillin-binding protein 5/6)
LPASTTKVMTAILVMEKLKLDKYVTVSANAVGAQPSKIYVKKGERYKVSDLLYAILLKSANDASIVLAEAVAGSESAFVNMMNKKAKAIGAKHTKFANSNGLPSQSTQYTTAYDMYLIFRHALKYPFFRDVIKKKYATIRSSTGRKISLKSHNTILFNNWKRKLYGKTGYTRKAQACFVGTMEDKGRTLIIGVFGCTRRWDDIRKIVRKYGGISL